MGRATRDDDEIARLHLDFPVRQPEGAGTIEDQLNLIRIRMVVAKRPAMKAAARPPQRTGARMEVFP
jgi:hypothetical protein